MQTSPSFPTIATTISVMRSTESVAMATLKFPARRLIIAGGFAVAVAAAPAVAFVATPAPAATPLAQCPAGEEEDLYVGTCVPHMVPNSPYQAVGNGGLPEVGIPGGGGSIPCTGHNTGECIGLEEEAQNPVVQPRSEVSSSPTVTGSEGSTG
jgi:hypothetical protein